MTIRISANRKVRAKTFVDAFADKSLKKASKAYRWAQIFLFTDVIVNSPVDTGRFRANWFPSIGSSSDATTSSTKRLSASIVRKEVMAAGMFSHMTITNNLPYSIALEYGHSKQAPNGMARKALKRSKKHINNAVSKVK